MTSPTWDLVGLGDCDVDIFVQVARLPSWDEKVPGDLLAIQGGGVAANFCCAAARLGLRTALVATVGDDHFGQIARQSLVDCGVDIGGVAIRPDAPTYFCTAYLDDRGEKALTIIRTPAFFPRWEDIDRERLSNTRVLHLAPFDLEVSARAAALAADAGAIISVDLEPAMVQAGLEPALALLRLTNTLIVNDMTVAALFGEGAHHEAARQLSELGPELVVVTRGARGSYALSRDQVIEMDAFMVNTRDTTGAGDCFNAALWASRLEGASLEQALRYASAAAALSVQVVGARDGLPGRADVDEFLAAQGGH